MSFSGDIKKATDRYKKGYNDVVNISLFKLSRSVVFMTPVDDGRARANWFASINGFDGSRVTVSTTSPLNQIESVSNIAAGNTFYLVNNLPYIGKLEFSGHSDQAINGMVRVSIENFQTFLDDTINNL